MCYYYLLLCRVCCVLLIVWKFVFVLLLFLVSMWTNQWLD
jgi:hypothetical protein